MNRRLAPFLLVGLLTACGAGGASGGGGGGGVPPIPPPAGPLDISNLVATQGTTRGSVVLRFSAPAGTGGAPVNAYVVKASVPQIATAADLPKAFVVPQSYAPQAPGSLETMTLSGLDPGQTLEFSVQAVRSGVVGPFSYAASTRVTEASAPPAPPSAILVSAPQSLSQDGGYYLLTQDVTALATAFEITARNVTLDLGGHKVTFGTGPARSHGVHAQFLSSTGSTTIQNGSIVQGGGGAADCYPVFLDEMHDVRVSHLDVTAIGPQSNGLALWYVDGFLRVDHCTVNLASTVVNDRHAGVCALDLGCSGHAEVDHNWVTGSPQWGIRIAGDSSTGTSLIHHNRITGTKALVANGYMIGVHMPDVDVFENDCEGESRGIHVDPRASPTPGCRVHDNVFRVQDQPNAEFPVHWVHGVKVEGASNANVHHNLVVGTADDQHSEVRCLDVDGAPDVSVNATGVEIRHNRFLAIANTATFQAVAFNWISGTPNAGNDIVVRHNVFSATDREIRHDDAGLHGGVLRDNVFVRDLTLGGGHPFAFEEFRSNAACPDNRLVEPITSESLVNVVEAASVPAYDVTREWTLTVVAVDAGGKPVSGAAIAVRDATSAVVFSGTTDANGRAATTVVETVVTNGPAFSDRTPHTLTVSKTGLAGYSGPVAVHAKTAVRVDLAAGTAAPDSTPPSAPTDVTSHSLAASRALFRWVPSTDESGVVEYLVSLDGVLVGVTDENTFSFFGLDAASTHTPSVQAVDAGGNRSVVVSGPAFTTAPEDRGP